MGAIALRGVTYRYPGAVRAAVTDVSVEWQAGEIIGLVGPSGSGKSTLGRLIKGLAVPDRGEILLKTSHSPSLSNSPPLPPLPSRGGEENVPSRGGGADYQPVKPPQLLIKLVGWAGAHPESQIFASTVDEEVAFAPRNQGLRGVDLESRVSWALSAVGLDEAIFSRRHPLTLSGGERRRLALAGVVAMRCEYYIFDEPTAGLDEPGLETFFGLLRSLQDDGAGVLWVTHEWELLQGRVDRLWQMREGRILADLASEQVDWRQVGADLAR